MEIKALAVIIPYLINFILLYNRKKNWAKGKNRWFGVSVLFLTGLVILLIVKEPEINKYKFVVWGIMTPFIFSVIDYIFKNLSFSLHDRDLYLWLRGSSDIDDSKLSGGKHVRASDRIFSMIMLFTVIFLPFIGMIVL
jgi:hypothetical protein